MDSSVLGHRQQQQQQSDALLMLVLETLTDAPDASHVSLPYIEYQQQQRFTPQHYYTCTLCQRRDLTEQALPFHCKEPSHQQAVLDLKASKERARVLLQRWNQVVQVVQQQPSASPSSTNHNQHRGGLFAVSSSPLSSTTKMTLQSLIDQLGLRAWKDAVQACLFRYLTSDDTTNNNVLMDEALATLTKYEHLERIALLQLAVWKAACLIQMPTTAAKDYFAVTQWLTTGWKTQKEAQQSSNSINIIMSTVLPFLGRHTEQEAVTTTTRNNFVYGDTARRPWNASTATSSSGNGGGGGLAILRLFEDLARRRRDERVWERRLRNGGRMAVNAATGAAAHDGDDDDDDEASRSFQDAHDGDDDDDEASRSFQDDLSLPSFPPLP